MSLAAASDQNGRSQTCYAGEGTVREQTVKERTVERKNFDKNGLHVRENEKTPLWRGLGAAFEG